MGKAKTSFFCWVPEYDKVAKWIDEALVTPKLEVHEVNVNIREVKRYPNGEAVMEDEGHPEYITHKETVICNTSIRTYGDLKNVFNDDNKARYPSYFYHGKGLFLMGSCGRGKSWITTKALPFLFCDCMPDALVINATDWHNGEAYYSKDFFSWDRIMKNDKPVVELKLLPSPKYSIYSADKYLERVEKNEWGDYTGDLFETSFLSSDFLCIDDIGMEGYAQDYGNKWYQLPRLVNDLYNADIRPIPLFSTNLSASQLAEKYGDRFVSRIKSLFYHGIAFTGKDYRGTEEKTLDLSALPFYHDYETYVIKHGGNVSKQGFVAYLRKRLQVPIETKNLDEAITNLK